MDFYRFIARDPVGARWTKLVTVMLTRLLILSLLMLVISVMIDERVSRPGVSIFLAVTFLITIAYSFWLRNEQTIRDSILYQFAVDVLVITGLIHFTGGINSVLSLLYPLVILAAGIVVSGRMALRVALLALILYATLVVLEATGVLAYQGPAPNPYAFQAKVYQTLMMEVLLFVIFAAAASYLSDQYFVQSKQLQRLRVIARATLDNVAVPLVAVAQDGRIVMANPCACTMLGMNSEELSQVFFHDLFVDSAPDIGSAADASRMWWMKRRDGSRFPISYQASTGNFPAAMLNAFQDNPEDVKLTLVAMRDVGDLIDSQAKTVEDVKQTAAADMITEMVHVVRNPLTAIRGASELINSAVESALGHQSEITSEDFITLKSLCNIIYEQTRDLDEKVDSFLTLASSGDRELFGEFIDQADHWAACVLNRKSK